MLPITYSRQFFVLCSLFFTSLLTGQNTEWVFQATGISGAPLVPIVFNNIDDDADGNIYLTSMVVDSTQFGPFQIHGTPIVPGVHLNASYIAKFNAMGEPQWVNVFEGTGQFFINDLIVDSEGNPIITGVLAGEVTIGETLFGSNFQDGEILIVKFDPDGDMLWSFMADSQPGFSRSAGVSLDVNSSDDIVVSGIVEANVSFGGVLVEDSRNLFLASFDKDGGMEWFRTYGYYFEVNTASEVAIDSEDNICWVGATSRNTDESLPDFDGITFDPFISSMFVAKFDEMGNIMWLNHYGEEMDAFSDIISNNIAVDQTNNDIIITGSFQDTVNLDGVILTEPTPLGSHLYVARFSADGDLKWARQSHGVANGADIFDISSTDMGSVFIGMRVSSSQGLSDFTLGENQNQQSFEINGSDNGVLAKYNSSGDLEWMKGISGFGFSPIMSVEAADNDAAIITGIFSEQVEIGSTTLDPGPTNFSANVFVARCKGGTSASVDLPSISIDLNIYPNPAVEQINIELKEDIQLESIQLSDYNGRVLETRALPGKLSKFNTGDLPRGTYFITTITENGQMVKKIILQ